MPGKGDGKRLSVDETEPAAAVSTEQNMEPAASSRNKPRQMSMSESLVRPVLDRIVSLERELAERLDLLAENRKLTADVHRLDQDVTRKDAEIEKLKNDLVYQKRLLEKEIEDRMRVLDEKWAMMDKEVSDRVARERDEFEKRLAAERNLWSERLRQEEERYAVELAEMQKKEGFWSRLVKMLTWS